MNEFEMKDKMRIVQELVPGKQITLAHVIANPDKILYKKLARLEFENTDGKQVSVPQRRVRNLYAESRGRAETTGAYG